MRCLAWSGKALIIISFGPSGRGSVSHCNGTAWKIIFRYGSFGVIRLSLVANGLVRFIIIIHYILWLSQDGQAGFSGVRHEPGMEWHGGQGIYHI